MPIDPVVQRLADAMDEAIADALAGKYVDPHARVIRALRPPVLLQEGNNGK